MHAEFLTSSKSKKDKILCRRYLFKLNTCTIFAMIVKKVLLLKYQSVHTVSNFENPKVAGYICITYLQMGSIKC